MNRVIALACAVDPLAFSDCLPPQLTAEAELDPLDPLDPDEVVLLSLPQADSSKALAANKLSAAPDRLSVT
jgi:hypothetical protein